MDDTCCTVITSTTQIERRLSLLVREPLPRVNTNAVLSVLKQTLLTLSCSNEPSIFSSRNALFEDVTFLKIFGIFLRATLLPVRGSVTDLVGRKIGPRLLANYLTCRRKIDTAIGLDRG